MKFLNGLTAEIQQVNSNDTIELSVGNFTITEKTGNDFGDDFNSKLTLDNNKVLDIIENSIENLLDKEKIISQNIKKIKTNNSNLINIESNTATLSSTDNTTQSLLPFLPNGNYNANSEQNNVNESKEYLDFKAGIVSVNGIIYESKESNESNLLPLLRDINSTIKQTILKFRDSTKNNEIIVPDNSGTMCISAGDGLSLNKNGQINLNLGKGLEISNIDKKLL